MSHPNAYPSPTIRATVRKEEAMFNGYAPFIE